MEILNKETPYHCLKNVQVGTNTKIFQFVNAYNCIIGDETKVGAFVEIQGGVKIGNRCKISSHSFICEGVEIEDGVFVGHNVSFINDKVPRALNADGSMQTEKDWMCEKTLVKKCASIGTSSPIMCGVTIGEYAVVGAGSVVTKDVPARTIVVGNPAAFLRLAE